jgi:hypothetical protein
MRLDLTHMRCLSVGMHVQSSVPKCEDGEGAAAVVELQSSCLEGPNCVRPEVRVTDR